MTTIRPATKAEVENIDAAMDHHRGLLWDEAKSLVSRIRLLEEIAAIAKELLFCHGTLLDIAKDALAEKLARLEEIDR